MSTRNRINTLARHLSVTGKQPAPTPVLSRMVCRATDANNSWNNSRRQKTAVTKWEYGSAIVLTKECVCFKQVVQAIPDVPTGKHVITFFVDGAGSGRFEARLQSFNKHGVEIPGENTGEWEPASDSLHWSKQIIIEGGTRWHPTCVYVRTLRTPNRSWFGWSSCPPARVRASMEVKEEFQVDNIDANDMAQDALTNFHKKYKKLHTKGGLGTLLDVIEYEPPPSEAMLRRKAMVMITGGYSTGKTSLIHSLLLHKSRDRTVEQSKEHWQWLDANLKLGVAPTTEQFTIITGGPDVEKNQNVEVWIPGDGKHPQVDNIISNVSYLKAHVKKVTVKDFPYGSRCMIVDSPGILNDNQRPYDFKKAVVKFAQAADIILFLFSADKVDIGGEVLATYNAIRKAIKNTPKKLMVLLNKANATHSPEDLAKALGTIMHNMARNAGDSMEKLAHDDQQRAGNVVFTSFTHPFADWNDRIKSDKHQQYITNAEGVLDKISSVNSKTLRLRMESTEQYFQCLRLYLRGLLTIWPQRWPYIRLDFWLLKKPPQLTPEQAEQLLAKELKQILVSGAMFHYSNDLDLKRLARMLSRASDRIYSAFNAYNKDKLPHRAALVRFVEQIDKLCTTDLQIVQGKIRFASQAEQYFFEERHELPVPKL